ncbi:MAG: chemotaxis protein CheW [Clostridia bacterium]|nr:chemotaxis protein CheW [Clostridia bacterium]
MAEMQIVVFSINNELCGAETSQVQEIVKYQEVAKVPKMPKFIDGIINLRGKVIPVVNLNTRFELGETEITKKTKIIISKLNNESIGFIVNDVTEIIKLSEDDVELPPEMLQTEGGRYLKCVGKHSGKLISILSLDRILTDKETKKLSETEFDAESDEAANEPKSKKTSKKKNKCN